jgi:thioesterase domain-containing protein
MARVYVEAIQTVQPTGPYRLGGWSFGGAIAYQMACLLRSGGTSVELVAMLDTAAPLELATAPDRADVLPLFATDLAGLFGAGADALITADELRGLTPDQQENAVLRRLERAGGLPAEVSGQLRERLRVFVANLSAGAVWRPPTYDGPVVLLTTGDRSAAVSRVDAWRRVAPVETATVPGDHYSMLRMPAVAALAQALQERWEAQWTTA